MNRDDKVKAIQSVSSSFCLAKWLQVTIDLAHGTNHSCHHPARHKIPLDEIARDPSALHNTLFKKARRQEMLKGIRPSECEYCWKIEDAKGTHYSDRLVKSLDDWAFPYLEKIKTMLPHESLNPTYVEVMFDKACHFSCSYCMADISSKIESEMSEFGPYPMKNNSHRLLTEKTKWKTPDDNPYIQAFWKWFPHLIKDLEVFRITGGEPLLSKNTFKFIEKLSDYPKPDLIFAINSNLGVSKEILRNLCNKVDELILQKKIGTFELYTSVDTFGDQAEFIRAGLNFNTYMENLEFFCRQSSVSRVILMGTFSLLSIPKFHLLLRKIYDLKQAYPKLILDLSYLKEPEYLRANIANKQLKEKLNEDLQLMQSFHEKKTGQGYSDHEINKFKRICHWVYENVDNDYLIRHKGDFSIFVDEYSKRKGFDFHQVFPELQSFYAEARKMALFNSKT